MATMISILVLDGARKSTGRGLEGKAKSERALQAGEVQQGMRKGKRASRQEEKVAYMILRFWTICD
jgi:hypothetical protein